MSSQYINYIDYNIYIFVLKIHIDEHPRAEATTIDVDMVQTQTSTDPTPGM